MEERDILLIVKKIKKIIHAIIMHDKAWEKENRGITQVLHEDGHAEVEEMISLVKQFPEGNKIFQTNTGVDNRGEEEAGFKRKTGWSLFPKELMMKAEAHLVSFYKREMKL